MDKYLINKARTTRRTNSTSFNSSSSRSHGFFRIHIIRGGKINTINFIDLAGKEKIVTIEESWSYNEAKDINTSLYDLRTILTHMKNKTKPNSVRFHPLTEFLKKYLNNNNMKVVMLANLSGEERNSSATYGTLTFASAI